MRIYDGDFTVARLVEDCSKPRRESMVSQAEPREIDVQKLNARLAELPVNAIRKRRRRMNAFYEEVIVSSDPDKGISFTSLLMILAHYNVINDNQSLRLHEFLRRRAHLQRVEEAVNRNIVMGFFDTVYWTRRMRGHRALKDAGRMTAVPQFSVPEIFVDEAAHDDDARGPFDGGLGPPSIASSAPSSPMYGAITPPSGSEAADLRALPPLRTTISPNSIQTSPVNSPTTLQFPQLSSPTRTRFSGHQSSVSQGSISEDWQFAQALSRPSSRDGPGEGSSKFGAMRGSPHRGAHGRSLSTRDAGEEPEARSRGSSNVSAQDVLEVLDNSAWGASIRKSFSTRSPSGDEGKKRS
jgi:hypothetical protein